MTLPGIDVSGSYQTPEKTTAEVTAGRAKFVIVKASEGQRTAGQHHDDLVAAARAAGAMVGHYHYAWAGNDPSTEVDNFLAHAKPRPGDLVALDLEEGKDGATWSMRRAYALAWLREVKGRTLAAPVLYLNQSWARGLKSGSTPQQWRELTSYPLWIATAGIPAGSPPDVGWPVWSLHQHSTAGGVDRNVFNGDSTTWRALAVPYPVSGHGASAPVTHTDSTPTPAPAPEAALQTVLYARRGTPDHTAASAWADATGRGAVTCDLGLAKAAAKGGCRVLAVGGPACDDLAGLAGVVPINGSDALDTLVKLTAARP